MDWSCLVLGVLATIPNYQVGSGSRSDWDRNCSIRSCHTKTRTVANGPALQPKTRHSNITCLAPHKYLTSDHIVTWSTDKLCSFMHAFTSHVQICDHIHIRWVTIENPQFLLHIWPFFTAIQERVVGLQIRKREGKESIKLQNLHIDHDTRGSEPRYLIGAKLHPQWKEP